MLLMYHNSIGSISGHFPRFHHYFSSIFSHLNDSTETKAVKLTFGKASSSVKMSSTKGNTGHLLGAAGAIETIITAKAIQESIVPPTINYKAKDEECDLNIVPNKEVKQEIKYAMSNSLGFGGHNASIILKKYEE